MCWPCVYNWLARFGQLKRLDMSAGRSGNVLTTFWGMFGGGVENALGKENFLGMRRNYLKGLCRRTFAKSFDMHNGCFGQVLGMCVRLWPYRAVYPPAHATRVHKTHG